MASPKRPRSPSKRRASAPRGLRDPGGARDVADPGAEGQANEVRSPTLAAYLRQSYPERSWNNVRALCSSGKVFVNGRRELDSTYRMQESDEVEVRESAPRVRRHEYNELRVLHQDPHLIVVHKPPHLATAPHDRKTHDSVQEPTVVDAVRPLVARGGGGRRRPGAPPPLFVVHRLDKETSGVLCFARSKGSERALHQVFKGHQAEREYVAIVYGLISPQTIESNLVRDRGDGIRGSASEYTPEHAYRQRALTHIVSAESLRGREGMYSRLRLRLETGRTHQIRIHLAEAGHPVVGEQVYIRDYRRDVGEPPACPRLMLHARSLAFTHPMTQEELTFEAPPPESWEQALRELLPT